MTVQQVEHTEAFSEQELAAWGVNDVAYVKAVTKEDGGQGYGIYAADGTQMAVMDDRDVAFAAVRQHDMEPLSVH